MTHIKSGRWITALCVGVSLLASNATADDEPFRPEAGKFPPLEKAHSYRGELVFVDHANRRGSLRVQKEIVEDDGRADHGQHQSKAMA